MNVSWVRVQTIAIDDEMHPNENEDTMDYAGSIASELDAQVLLCVTFRAEIRRSAAMLYYHLSCRDDKDTDVCQRRATDHVGHIVLMTWRVQDCIPLGICCKMCPSHLQPHATQTCSACDDLG